MTPAQRLDAAIDELIRVTRAHWDDVDSGGRHPMRRTTAPTFDEMREAARRRVHDAAAGMVACGE